jgi:hypothetical protein
MKNATFQCFLEMIFSSFYRLAFVHSILVVAAARSPESFECIFASFFGLDTKMCVL